MQLNLGNGLVMSENNRVVFIKHTDNHKEVRKQILTHLVSDEDIAKTKIVFFGNPQNFYNDITYITEHPNNIKLPMEILSNCHEYSENFHTLTDDNILIIATWSAPLLITNTILRQQKNYLLWFQGSNPVYSNLHKEEGLDNLMVEY